MRRNQKGFSLVELLLIIVAIGLIGGAGLYVYQTHANKTKTVAATQPGWLAYKSTKSSVSFSYPPNWHLKNLLSKSKTGGLLEDVGLDGPNNFTMEYYLETPPTGPQNAACMAPPKSISTPLNNQYLMVLTYYTGGSSGTTITMRSANRNDLVSHNCQTFNSLASNLVFNFFGYYQYGSPHYHMTDSSAYLKLPEVRTAKAIFASFKPNPSPASNSANSTSTQCGCQEGNTCADISACEGQSTTSNQ